MAKITRQTIEELIPAIVIIILFILIFFVYRTIPEQTIRNLIQSAGIFGPIVWILLSLSSYVFAPMSNAPLLLTGFYAFGRWVILYYMIVSIIGAVINFTIARKWGRRVVVHFTGRRALDTVDHATKHYGPLTLFFLRIFLSGMHDTVSYVAGLTNISFKEYYIVTLLALIPATLLSYFSSLLTDNPVIFLIIGFVLSTVLTVVFFGGRYVLDKYHKTDQKL